MAIECLLEADDNDAALIFNISELNRCGKKDGDKRVIKLPWSVISCHCPNYGHIATFARVCHSLGRNLQTVGAGAGVVTLYHGHRQVLIYSSMFVCSP